MSTFQFRFMMHVLSAIVGLLTASRCLADETLTLQGPSPRLIFDDNDGAIRTWTVSGNDSIFDIKNTAGSTVFGIAPTAPSHSLRIGTSGIGIRRQNPLADLHIAGGFTTTLRLDCP